MNFGEKIRTIRKKLDFTQKKLADKSGIHYSTICKYEKGDISPSIEAVKKIADTLNISIDYLMDEGNEINPEKRIQDKELLALFEKIDKLLDERGRVIVKELLDAMIKKHSLEKMMS